MRTITPKSDGTAVQTEQSLDFSTLDLSDLIEKGIGNEVVDQTA